MPHLRSKLQDRKNEKSNREFGGVSEVQREVLSEVIFQAFKSPAKVLMVLTIGIL